MATITTDGRTIRVVLAAGETSIPIFIAPEDEVVIAVTPGVGGSMSVQAAWSMSDAVQANQGLWHSWDQGEVTAPTTQSLFKSTAVLITATTQPGIAEIRS